jgi:hypothetical protein
MKLQFGEKLLVLAAPLALGACAATGAAGSHPTGPTNVSAPASVPTAADNSPKAYGAYVRVVRNGQTLYCQKDSDTATRMVHETCLTQAQAQAQQENAHNFMQDAQGIANTPASGPYGH